MTPELFWGGVWGTVGTVIVFVVRWLLTRGEREVRQVKADVKQQAAIDDSIAKVAALWREDNKDLRARAGLMELKQAGTEARLEEVLKANTTLHQDNLTLTEKNGALTEKADSQAGQIKQLNERVSTLQTQVAYLQTDNLTLINAMRQAGIPIPALSTDTKLGTGPLKGA